MPTCGKNSAVSGLVKSPKNISKDFSVSSGHWVSELRRWTVASTTDLPRADGHGVHGVVGVHVGDLLGGGDQTFSEVLAQLCNDNDNDTQRKISNICQKPGPTDSSDGVMTQ